MVRWKVFTAWVWVGVAAAVATAQPLAQPGERLLPILDTFQGTAANDKRPEFKTGFVATGAEWKAVWAKLNPKEKPPEIDFARHFLLITVYDAADPNHHDVSVFRDEDGVVRVTVMSTLIGFRASDRTTYRFHKVSRSGVTGVRRDVPARDGSTVDPLPAPIT